MSQCYELLLFIILFTYVKMNAILIFCNIDLACDSEM